MTQEEKVAYWLDLADYDIETAEGLFVVRAIAKKNDTRILPSTD